MVLVDTSVWVEHLRADHAGLAELLNAGQVLCHPFVIGELACGNLVRRSEVLGLLGDLPEACKAEDAEVLGLTETAALKERGVGWVDVHLLAAARLGGSLLWTLDRRLANVAGELNVGFIGR